MLTSVIPTPVGVEMNMSYQCECQNPECAFRVLNKCKGMLFVFPISDAGLLVALTILDQSRQREQMPWTPALTFFAGVN